MMHHRASACQTKVCDLWLRLSRLHVAAECRHVCKGQFSSSSGTPQPTTTTTTTTSIPEGRSVRRVTAVKAALAERIWYQSQGCRWPSGWRSIHHQPLMGGERRREGQGGTLIPGSTERVWLRIINYKS